MNFIQAVLMKVLEILGELTDLGKKQAGVSLKLSKQLKALTERVDKLEGRVTTPTYTFDDPRPLTFTRPLKWDQLEVGKTYMRCGDYSIRDIIVISPRHYNICYLNSQHEAGTAHDFPFQGQDLKIDYYEMDDVVHEEAVQLKPVSIHDMEIGKMYLRVDIPDDDCSVVILESHSEYRAIHQGLEATADGTLLFSMFDFDDEKEYFEIPEAPIKYKCKKVDQRWAKDWFTVGEDYELFPDSSICVGWFKSNTFDREGIKHHVDPDFLKTYFELV